MTNTGSPQGCVLSAFLFIIYTNDMSTNNDHSLVLKYADDTVITGYVENDNEDHYMETITNVSEWCNNNHLELNVSKTKEMVFDFRRNKCQKSAVMIDNKEVNFVSSYKYLGCIIQDDLK